MSEQKNMKNSLKNNAARNDAIESALDADYMSNNDMKLLLEEVKAEERYAALPSPLRVKTTRYVSAEGLAQLAEKGVTAFHEAVERNVLPHNFVRTEMSGSVGSVGPHGRQLPFEEADSEIESHARMGGWLKAASGFPALRKVIERTQSWRGVNSLRTLIDLWELQSKFPSPGGLERRLWAVKRRAQSIFSAYEGSVEPSWAGIAIGLLANASTGKAAIIAVAYTLGGRHAINNTNGSIFEQDYRISHRTARDWLAELHTYSVEEEEPSEGAVMRQKEPKLVEGGIEVYAVAQQGEYHQWSLGCKYLVRSSSGKAYYTKDWCYSPVEAMEKACKHWDNAAKAA